MFMVRLHVFRHGIQEQQGQLLRYSRENHATLSQKALHNATDQSAGPAGRAVPSSRKNTVHGFSGKKGQLCFLPKAGTGHHAKQRRSL